MGQNKYCRMASNTFTRNWPMNEDACYPEQMNIAARNVHYLFFGFLVKHSIHEKAHQKPCESVQIPLCVCVCFEMHVHV